MKKNCKYYDPRQGFIVQGIFIDKLSEKVIKMNMSGDRLAQAFTINEVEANNHHYELRGNQDNVVDIDNLKVMVIRQDGSKPMGEVYMQNGSLCINFPRDSVLSLN